ncbi:MAG: response regulator [bacterium]|nr:response regulator [bacterium]
MPILKPPVTPTAAPTRPAAAPKRTRELQCVERLTRILIVEDEPLTAEVFAKALSRAGHQVETASDGLQALNRLRQRIPTAIVLDMNLPAVPGADVVRRLRADGHTRVPIIVVSGSHPSAAGMDEATMAPGIWLEKPVKPRELVAVVQRFVPTEDDDGSAVE